jgi:lipopolysaccharide transport system permease protein
MRFQIENYTYFLLAALFPWTWFSSSVIISSRSLVDNVSLIRKVIFPRHYLVASVIFAQLINLVFSIPILYVLALIGNISPNINWLIGIPILIFVQILFTFGISLVIAISNTYFRDIEYLVTVLMNLLFWMTPIIYPMESIPAKYRVWIMMNPLTSMMASWRNLFIQNEIVWTHIGIALGMAVLFLFIGLSVFKNLEKKLDEVL